MNNLRHKTISGFIWVIAENIGNQFTGLIIGIFLARLLSPSDYGLVGMLAVFIIISQVFVDAGFGAALIQKKDVTEKDYSTIFVFNLVISLVLYIIICFSSEYISFFYKQDLIKQVLPIISLGLIINSFSMVQRTRLIKELNFKIITKISIFTSITSGIFGVILAILGYGLWSLVFKTLSQQLLDAILLTIWSKWFPKLNFDFSSFKSLFRFANKLLLSNLVSTISDNIYVFIIGKIHSPAELGYYSRAQQFKDLALNVLTNSLDKVTYPVLSKLQDNINSFMIAYTKLITISFFVTSFTMALIFTISEPLIILTIGHKWTQSIELLQLLCFIGVLYPVHAINLNLLKVKGRSDLFLRLEIIKKSVSIPIVVLMSFWGIKYMILGSIGTSFLSIWINTYYTGQLIDYSGVKQMLDILPSLLLGAGSALLTYLISLTLPDIMWLQLIILSLSMTSFYILGSIIFKFEEFYEIKNILIGFLTKKPALQ